MPEMHPIFIQYINTPTEEMQLLAVKFDSHAINYINNPTPKVRNKEIEIMRVLSISEKRVISRYVRKEYKSSNPRNVRFAAGGGVSAMVDRMPNTNKQGRIFVGWDFDLLNKAQWDNANSKV